MTKTISIPTTMAINAPMANNTMNLFWLLVTSGHFSLDAVTTFTTPVTVESSATTISVPMGITAHAMS